MFGNISVRNQLVLLAAIVSLVVLLIGSFSLYSLYRAERRLAEAQTLSRTLIQTVDTARNAQVHFKKQVQEWKNILLRGNDQEAFDKFLENFAKEEKAVQDCMAALDGLMGKLSMDRSRVGEVVKALGDLDVKYRDALNSYDKSDPLSYKVVDKLVKGMDRPLTDAIDGIVKYIGDYSDKAYRIMESESDAAKKRSFSINIGLIIVALLMVGYFSLMILRGLFSRIGNEPKHVNEVLTRVAEGDLTVTVKLNDRNRNSVYGAIGAMVEKLREVLRGIRAAADKVASSSHELSAMSERISGGTNEQADSLTRIAGASEEMTQTIMEMAKNTLDIAGSVAETARVAGEGETIANKSAREVAEIADTISESAGLVKSLGERSKQIGDIVNVINDVADQTNLLALNAAIEAARAGEHGRGFAVVADEVKKLAERTARSTSEISEMIKAIQNEVKRSILSMERVTEKVMMGVDLANNAGESLAGVVKNIGDLNSMIHQIASANEQMSATSREISGEIESIANVSRETSGSSRQTAEASASLATLSKDLQGILNQFRT